MKFTYLGVLVLLVWANLAAAQAPDPGKFSAEEFKVKATRGNRVKMRDGVDLSVDIWQPDDDQKHPAILIITPYSNNGSGGNNRAQWFAKRGYVMAIADSRGRYDSDGDWDPFNPKHKTDGYDLVEWLAARPWCTGKVGMTGASYMGWTQWWTATQAPPSLKAIVPEVSPPDQFYNCPYQQGILVCFAMDWAASQAGHTAQAVSDGAYGGFFKTRLQDYMHTPYVKLNEYRGAMDAPWFDKWIRNVRSTDDYWRKISYQNKESYSKVNVPALNITGWFDADQPGSPMNYLAMKQYGANPQAKRPRLVIGPWEHSFNGNRKLAGIDYGADAVINWDGYVCRWFDHYLKGADNGVENDPPVFVFVMGRNRWYAEKDWPLPQTKFTKYYLHGGGKANLPESDGTLSTTPPAKEPADRYTYDPAHPTLCAFQGGHIDGAVDTTKRAADAPAWVAGPEATLAYTSPVLSEDTEVTGPLTAKLFAATSALDTDWMVRLIDVQPDGAALLLCDGVMRARYRDPNNAGAFNPAQLSQIESGKVYEYTLAFWRATGNLFQKGHRIRVEISSSYFPYYFRNLNTGADNVGLETAGVVANQQIYHDAEHPSHIVLPVIPAR